jgi:hypothetical protein
LYCKLEGLKQAYTADSNIYWQNKGRGRVEHLRGNRISKY